jgi:hypothetical protein
MAPTVEMRPFGHGSARGAAVAGDLGRKGVGNVTTPMRNLDRNTEHDHLRIMIEQMQRAGHDESQINAAVREARGEHRSARPSRMRALRAYVPWL